MTDPKPAPTSDELAALIEADKRARGEQAQREIDELCRRLRVSLVPTVQIMGDKISAGLTIVPE